ncbi:MAG: NUDIX domain-containing protein, partial [Nanoarchaeota archaeon]
MDQERGKMQVATDAVVFTVEHDILKILLIKRKNQPFQGKFALPGGFVNPNEEFEDAVKRELFEETNVKNIFVKQ